MLQTHYRLYFYVHESNLESSRLPTGRQFQGYGLILMIGTVLMSTMTTTDSHNSVEWGFLEVGF